VGMQQCLVRREVLCFRGGEEVCVGCDGVVNGEDSKLVGKQPEDKNYNTVGKAAEALKEKIVHAEL